jgi:acylphosphatase
MTARITGRVQGVGFRWWALRHAEALQITGWVMNGDDDRVVEVVAEGEVGNLGLFEQRLRSGPSGARIDAFTAQRSPASGEFERFGIAR